MPVDPPRQRVEIAANVLIALHVGARRRRDLQQIDQRAAIGIVLQEPFVAEEALGQSLRIIEPVDADDHRSPDPAFEHAHPDVARDGTVGAGDEVLGVDADRAADRADRPPADRDAPVLAERTAHLVRDVVAERFEPFARLEPDHVIGEQRLDQPLVVGQRNEQPGRRPGDMEEEPHAVLQPLLAQQPAQRDHVVIVHPDEVVGRDVRRDLLAEDAVHPLVAALIVALELGQIEPVVEQRPQRRIGIAVVIFLDLLLGEVDRPRGDAAIGLEMELVVGADLARPAEPDAAALFQRRGQRDRQPALRGGLLRAGRRHPVRDDDDAAQRIALQGFDNSTAQLISPTSE